MEFYQPKYFRPYELFPQEVWEAHNNRPDEWFWQRWMPQALYTIDRIRERYGPTTCNDYHWGGQYQERGYRLPRTTTGASWSMHKFFGAIDSKCNDFSAFQIREDILADPWCDDFKYITCIEVGPTVTWLHMDFRNWNKTKHGILQVTI